ncbi:MAG TPA: hypothetical protein DCX32_04390 [Candidatus Moranbacteria bacterium]|nr:MAG: hypothetical protein UW87_C0002G0014 [Candidatus Moranbacteria bacterium GW2011_GWC2_45_10]KKT95185.1 MAG: hypothetical protein UW95_C0003G0027 [Parcubacteria group bacterium GW2011_GWC1_45_14]HAV11746.1 hypothetical protein [Candidatus Moranbacteria bacterium]
MEGNFLKMPNGQEGNTFVRKPDNLSEKKYQNIKADWEKREVRDDFGRISKMIERHEMKKTPEQRKILELVVEEANALLGKYAEKESKASVDFIKLVDAGFFKEVRLEKAVGVCVTFKQVVAVMVDRKTSKTELAETAFHELMHLFGFSRIVLEGGKSDGYADVSFERTGLAISSSKDEKDQYFGYINEAVTTELTNRFHARMKSHEMFRDEVWILKKRYGAHEPFPPVLWMREGEGGDPDPVARVTYEEEHEKAMAMFEHIHEKNPEKFKSAEEVFDFFAKAYFSGRLLPVARLIEKTYGKGFFRKIGEESMMKF